MNASGLKNILLPTDFSNWSENALQTALMMCSRHNAILHILHVVENQLIVAPPQSNLVAMYVVENMAEKGEKALHSLVEQLQASSEINMVRHIRYGNAADNIRDTAIELNIDLIIMGTHGNSGIRELFIGNTVYAVIKNSTIPVLSVPASKKVIDFKKILFPVKAATGIMDKYDFISPIIQQNKASVIVLGLALKSEILELEQREKELIELGKSLGMNNTNFKSMFHICSSYAKKVLEIAKKEKVDLIVINATLDYKWKDLFIGPYAQQVVNHAKVPVLSIRSPYREDETAG